MEHKLFYEVQGKLVRWKFADVDEEQGATAHRWGVYMEILDESSTGVTQLFAAAVEFRMH